MKSMKNKTKNDIVTRSGIRVGDLVQAAAHIGARVITPHLFDEDQQPIRMLVLDVVDENAVVVLLNGQPVKQHELYLQNCKYVGIGTWKTC